MAAHLFTHYALGNFALETETRVLSHEGRPVHLAHRPFQVLLYLAENHERVVSRRELLDLFWDGKDVYDETLTKCVGAIRHALHDKGKQPLFIETRYAEGYRYIGPWEEQLTHNGTSVVEIEKTHGVRIVAEEEIHDSAPTETQTPHAIIAPAVLVQPRRFRREIILVAASIAVTLLVAGIVAFRSRNAGQTPLPARSIAVLPLKNLTGDARNEYFSDGVTESIITELSRVGELRVISRSSTFTLKGKEIDPREIGKKLNVDALLEGSVQKKGDLLSVSVRLISTQDGRVLWTSQNFERPPNTAYELQDTISCNVANELRAELCGATPGRNTHNADAYQAYLKGRFYWNKRTGDGIKKSIEYYNEAIKSDANYARAYAGLADSYVQGVWHVPFAPEEVVSKAKAAALRAVALDDSLTEAHTALASVYQMEWDWAATGRELQRAIELNPNYARAYHVQAFNLMLTGRNDEAVASIEHAHALDPLNLVINTDVANVLFGVRRVDEALRQWEKTLELDPNFVLVYRQRAEAYIFKGDEAAAAADYLKEMELDGEPEKLAAYRQAYAAHGLKGFWRKQLDELLAQRARGGYASPIGLAYLYMRLGQKDEALAQMEQVYHTRSATIVLAVSPMFDPLRADPRFADLLRRTDLAH